MRDRHRISGIQEPLPAGEELVWEGTPTIRGIAHRVLHERWVLAYFALLIGLTLVQAPGRHPGEVVARVVWLTLLAGVVFGLLRGLAAWIRRSSHYSVTNRRIIIQKGIVLPSVVNVPFERIQGLQLRSFADGTGDLVLELVPGARVGYVFLWPHVRPWRLSHPSPMLRSVPDAERAAQMLRDAYLAFTSEVTPSVQTEPTRYRLLDDDDTEVMNNRSPRGTERRHHATSS